MGVTRPDERKVFVSRDRDISCLIPPAQIPHERSLAHAALISDDRRRSVARDKDAARVEKEATAWQCDHAFPRHPTLLTAAAQNVPPHAKHPFLEHAEAIQIPGHCVVVEVALYNCTEPFAGVRRSVVLACAELLLDLLQLCPHTPADRNALYGKTSVPVFSADVREAQEIESLRLTFPSARSIFFGEPPELNQTRLIWVQFQSKHGQSFP